MSSTPVRQTRSVPLPPCGGGVGRGRICEFESAATPLPDPSPARAEGTVRRATRHQRQEHGARGTQLTQAHLHRPRRAPRGRAAHALHLAAEGARGRHRAQSRNAGRRDEAADPDRDPHRRHAGVEAPAPAPRSAAYPADDAGAAGADPGVARRAVPVRLAAPRGARRVARAGDVEARRSALARAGAAVRAGAGPDLGRALGDGRGAGRPAPLSAAAAAERAHARRSRDRRRRRAAACHHARHRRAAALGRAYRAARHRRDLRR